MAEESTIGGSGSMFVGEDKTLRLELIDTTTIPEGGTAADATGSVDMTAWTMVFDVRKKDNSSDPAILSLTPTLTGVFNATRATNTQRAIVILTDDDLNLFKAKNYPLELETHDIGGRNSSRVGHVRSTEGDGTLMAVIIDATVGGISSNSFASEAEVNLYYETRLPLEAWEDADDSKALIVMACRYMTAMFAPLRKLIRVMPPGQSYYLLRPTWTGAVATTTQRLPWPRTGMFDVNGNAILETVIPQALKEAQAEFAIQLAAGDRTLDNDVALQGITSVKAGSVAVSFKNAGIETTVIIPDAVWALLVPSWLTDEIMEFANRATFEVVSDYSMALIDILRKGVSIANKVTKSVQSDVTFYRYLGSSGAGVANYAPAVTLKAAVDWKQKQVRTLDGVLSVSRAMVMFLDIKALQLATNNGGIDDHDLIILPDGTTGPILDMAGFIDPGTEIPLATEVYIG